MAGGGSYGSTNGFGGGDKMSNLGANLKAQNFDLNSLPKFEKSFYKEDPSVASRSQSDVEAFRRQHLITVTGKNVQSRWRLLMRLASLATS